MSVVAVVVFASFSVSLDIDLSLPSSISSANRGRHFGSDTSAVRALKSRNVRVKSYSFRACSEVAAHWSSPEPKQHSPLAHPHVNLYAGAWSAKSKLTAQSGDFPRNNVMKVVMKRACDALTFKSVMCLQ